MTRCLTISIVSIIGNLILCLHPLPNKTANFILGFATLALYGITLAIAYGKEQNLKDRIQALEDKLKDKENTK